MRLPTKRSYTSCHNECIITLVSITRFANRLLRKSCRQHFTHISLRLRCPNPSLQPSLSLWICPLQDVEGQTIKMQWSISCWMLQLWLACEGVSTDPGTLVYSCSLGIKIQYRISSPPVDNVTGWVGYIWSFRLRAWCTQWSSTLFIGSLHHGTMKSTGRILLICMVFLRGSHTKSLSHWVPRPF